MKEVVIVQRVVCEYRKAFYSCLRKELSAKDINLRLITGTPRRGEEAFDVLDDLSFGERRATTYFYKTVCWIHGLHSATKSADMVILVQENAALYTYPFLLMRLMGKEIPRLGFWGHGANMGRVDSRILLDKWREFWLRRVDWWFAYTAKTKGILTTAGFSSDRITVVNNSTDTTLLREIVNKQRARSDQLFAEIFCCSRSRESRVGFYCGRLIESKMILFLLDSIKQIHARLPGFFMIIVGDGPLSEDVKLFCADNNWCKWTGAKWSSERADYLSVADIWLNPGALGLAVTDAFAAGLPLATTDNKIHGPEISYLEDQKTGLMTKNVVGEYVDSVARILTEDGLLVKAKAEAQREGYKYSAEMMANRFAAGIDECMKTN